MNCKNSYILNRKLFKIKLNNIKLLIIISAYTIHTYINTKFSEIII